eukprot:11150639-Alexandrium_andersonii.AAC.1
MHQALKEPVPELNEQGAPAWTSTHGDGLGRRRACENSDAAWRSTEGGTALKPRRCIGRLCLHRAERD